MVDEEDLEQFKQANDKQTTTLKENPFGKKKIYVEMDSDTYDKLVKYVEENAKVGNIILLDGIVDRIITEWYIKALKAWCNQPNLRPKLTGKAPTNVNQIKANKVHAKNFTGYCDSLNYNPAELLTWLAERFIEQWNLVKRQQVLKKRNIMK